MPSGPVTVGDDLGFEIYDRPRGARAFLRLSLFGVALRQRHDWQKAGFEAVVTEDVRSSTRSPPNFGSDGVLDGRTPVVLHNPPMLPASFTICYHPRFPEFIRGVSASNQREER
jgi:hypothetical protein